MSLFTVLLATILFLGIKYLLYSLKDNFGLEREQAVVRLSKKTKLIVDSHFFNLTMLEYYPHASQEFFFFHFEINGTKVEYEVPRDLYDEAGDNQFLFINYAVTQLSKKIKVRKVQLMHFSECLE
ncbi:hypothetical protein D4R99_04220 [bacterium]|nr:MAG: hypothetical protein D4R99_04220 [bacterium]